MAGDGFRNGLRTVAAHECLATFDAGEAGEVVADNLDGTWLRSDEK